MYVISIGNRYFCIVWPRSGAPTYNDRLHPGLKINRSLPAVPWGKPGWKIPRIQWPNMRCFWTCKSKGYFLKCSLRKGGGGGFCQGKVLPRFKKSGLFKNHKFWHFDTVNFVQFRQFLKLFLGILGTKLVIIETTFHFRFSLYS